MHELGLGAKDFVPHISGAEMNILGGHSEDNVYLLALSAVLTKAAMLREVSEHNALQEMMRSIAADLSEDGALDSKWKIELENAAVQVDPHQVSGDLATYLKSLGVSVGLPHLDFVLNPKHSTAGSCLLSYIDPKLCDQAVAHSRTIDSDVAQQLRAFDKKVLTQLQSFEKELEPYPEAGALQVDVWSSYPSGAASIAEPDAYQVRVVATTDVDYPVQFPYTCRDDVVRHWRSVPVNLTDMVFMATELAVGRNIFGKKKTRLQYQGVVTLDLPDGRRLDHRQYKVAIFTHRGAVERLVAEAPVNADGSYRALPALPTLTALRATLIKISNDQVVALTHRTVTRPNAPVWTSRGQWMAPRVVEGKKTFELVDKATGEVVDAVSEDSNLLVSYRVPYSDGLYRYLSHTTKPWPASWRSIVSTKRRPLGGFSDFSRRFLRTVRYRFQSTKSLGHPSIPIIE